MSGALAAQVSKGGPGLINTAMPNATGVGSISWQVNADGSHTITGDGGGNWIAPANAATAALWQVKVDVTSGTITTGTTGTWLSAPQTWTKVGIGIANITFSVRELTSQNLRSAQNTIVLTVI